VEIRWLATYENNAPVQRISRSEDKRDTSSTDIRKIKREQGRSIFQRPTRGNKNGFYLFGEGELIFITGIRRRNEDRRCSILFGEDRFLSSVIATPLSRLGRKMKMRSTAPIERDQFHVTIHVTIIPNHRRAIRPIKYN